MQISLYSHIAETHDEITKLPGSFKRTIEGAQFLRDAGVKVIFANVLMKQNADHYKGVQALAASMGIRYEVDATITPMMDGDRGIVDLNMDPGKLAGIMHDTSLLGDQAERLLAAPSGPTPLEEAYETLPCSAGHTACYISPYGDVFPCVQFPYKVGSVREQAFIDIWRDSPQLNDVRSIRVSDLHGCSSCVHGSSCTRCPGLAYLEGNMRGPSIQDCEKSFARTGVPSWNLQQKQGRKIPLQLIVA
ncbi:MAG: SPASM domain-containing protein [Thermomonas sp.]|uniref:radical SAM protein n=1 Tax=Thermomonas sp. TaxID=1971895 RepID=UPI0025E38D63|nr:radical SAM protein [Thermomonas sp.]MBK6924787.1 SPASM domain-containing protein [Thermomonas sp.]